MLIELVLSMSSRPLSKAREVGSTYDTVDRNACNFNFLRESHRFTMLTGLSFHKYKPS